MDNQRKSLLITIAVALLIIAMIIGLIYYLIRFVQSRRVATTNATPRPSAQVMQPSPGTNQPAQPQSNPATGGNQSSQKAFNNNLFQFRYPNNWGVLTCSNSGNIELDPQSSTDQRNVPCDTATKPVTFIMGDSSGCSGETVTLGQVRVQKQRLQDGGYSKYQWCIQSDPRITITHRVSNGGEPATSRQDYSSQIEELIKTLTFARGS